MHAQRRIFHDGVKLVFRMQPKGRDRPAVEIYFPEIGTGALV
jgi:hypothetical protein